MNACPAYSELATVIKNKNEAARNLLALFDVDAAFEDSNARARCTLNVSPSLTTYVRGVYRARSIADSRSKASLVWPPFDEVTLLDV